MRDSFVFYASWMEAIDELPTQELRNEAVGAVLKYGLNQTTEEEWEKLSPFVRVVLKLIKPMVDKNQKLYENAKKGGRKKAEEAQEDASENQISEMVEEEKNQTKTKNEPNQNQNESLVEKNRNQPHKNNVNVNVNVNDNVNVNENSLSPHAHTRERSETLSQEEREICLGILIFDKKIKRPDKELDKFESFYRSRGWKDTYGREIADRIALLKTWDAKNANTFKAEEVKIWKTIVDVLKENGQFSPLLLTDFTSAEIEENRDGKKCRIRGTKNLGQYFHQVMTDSVYNCIKTAISGANIVFHEVNRIN